MKNSLKMVLWLYNTKMMKCVVVPFMKKVWPGIPIPIKVYDNVLYANSWDRLVVLLLWKFRISEAFEIELMKELAKPGMTVIDVGANVGLYAFVLSKLVGPKGQVHAFEPNTSMAYLLSLAMVRNDRHNVMLHDEAVSDRNGTTRLFTDNNNMGDSRIGNVGVSVRMVALDSVLKKERVGIVKMDIQGAELLAIRGMKRLLQRSNAALFVEFCPSLLRECGTKPAELLSTLNELGYVCYYIDEINRGITKMTNEELLEIAAKDFYVNLFCQKHERSQ